MAKQLRKIVDVSICIASKPYAFERNLSGHAAVDGRGRRSQPVLSGLHLPILAERAHAPTYRGSGHPSNSAEHDSAAARLAGHGPFDDAHGLRWESYPVARNLRPDNQLPEGGGRNSRKLHLGIDGAKIHDVSNIAI